MAPVTRSRSRRWADLPPELVEAILRCLPLDDYFPFGLACKSWWFAMINARSLFKPPPLLILKPGNPLRSHRAMDAQVTRLCSIRGGGKHRDVPTMMFMPNPFTITHAVPATGQRAKAKSTPESAPAARCCGSSMGWLFMVGVHDESSAHLLNPVTAAKVTLPALPPYFTMRGRDDVLCSHPASDPDCILAVRDYTRIHTFPVRISVFLTCRPNHDDKWLEIRFEKGNVYSYALYEARLYVISEPGMFIYSLDPRPARKLRVHSVVHKTIDPALTPITLLLAVVDGKLLCVSGRCTGPCRAYEFVDNCRWVKIQSLGEWVLLLTRFTSQAFSTKLSPALGFRANCIYRISVDCIRVHPLEDESFSTIPPPPPEAGSQNIFPTKRGYQFMGFWFLAQSW